jgi:hypothetical protein
MLDSLFNVLFSDPERPHAHTAALHLSRSAIWHRGSLKIARSYVMFQQ